MTFHSDSWVFTTLKMILQFISIFIFCWWFKQQATILKSERAKNCPWKHTSPCVRPSKEGSIWNLQNPTIVGSHPIPSTTKWNIPNKAFFTRNMPRAFQFEKNFLIVRRVIFPDQLCFTYGSTLLLVLFFPEIILGCLKLQFCLVVRVLKISKKDSSRHWERVLLIKVSLNCWR